MSNNKPKQSLMNPARLSRQSTGQKSSKTNFSAFTGKQSSASVSPGRSRSSGSRASKAAGGPRKSMLPSLRVPVANPEDYDDGSPEDAAVTPRVTEELRQPSLSLASSPGKVRPSLTDPLQPMGDIQRIEGELWYVTAKTGPGKKVGGRVGSPQWVVCEDQRLSIYSGWGGKSRLLEEMQFDRVRLLFNFSHLHKHNEETLSGGPSTRRISLQKGAVAPKNHFKPRVQDKKLACYYYFGVEGIKREVETGRYRRQLIVLSTDQPDDYKIWINFWTEMAELRPMVGNREMSFSMSPSHMEDGGPQLEGWDPNFEFPQEHPASSIHSSDEDPLLAATKAFPHAKGLSPDPDGPPLARNLIDELADTAGGLMERLEEYEESVREGLEYMELSSRALLEATLDLQSVVTSAGGTTGDPVPKKKRPQLSVAEKSKEAPLSPADTIEYLQGEVRRLCRELQSVKPPQAVAAEPAPSSELEALRSELDALRTENATLQETVRTSRKNVWDGIEGAVEDWQHYEFSSGEACQKSEVLAADTDLVERILTTIADHNTASSEEGADSNGEDERQPPPLILEFIKTFPSEHARRLKDQNEAAQRTLGDSVLLEALQIHCKSVDQTNPTSPEVAHYLETLRDVMAFDAGEQTPADKDALLQKVEHSTGDLMSLLSHYAARQEVYCDYLTRLARKMDCRAFVSPAQLREMVREPCVDANSVTLREPNEVSDLETSLSLEGRIASAVDHFRSFRESTLFYEGLLMKLIGVPNENRSANLSDDVIAEHLQAWRNAADAGEQSGLDTSLADENSPLAQLEKEEGTVLDHDRFPLLTDRYVGTVSVAEANQALCRLLVSSLHPPDVDGEVGPNLATLVELLTSAMTTERNRLDSYYSVLCDLNDQASDNHKGQENRDVLTQLREEVNESGAQLDCIPELSAWLNTSVDEMQTTISAALQKSNDANDELEKLREEIRALEEERAAVQSVLDGDVAEDAKEKGSGDDEGEQKGDGERRPLADQVVQLKDQHAAELADEQAKLQDALAKIDAERGDSGVVPNTEVARHASDAAEGGRPPLSADEVAEHVRRLREERDAAEEGEAALRDAVYDAIGAEAAAPYKERDAEVDRTRGERCGLVGETEDHIASGDADGAADAAARHAAAEEAHENAKKARADDLPRLREELERAREESAGANDELEKLQEEIRALEEERAAVQSVLDGDVADDAKEKGSGDDEGEQKGDGERRPLADQVVQLKDQHAAELADEQAKLQDALAKIDAERGDSGVVPNTEVARHASDAAEGGRPPLSADEVAEHVRRLREERDAAEEGEAALRDAVYDAIGAEAAAPYKERDAEVDRTRGERCGLVGETEDHIASGDADGAADAAARHAAAEEAHENAKKARADDLPRLREELERAREESADANDELEKLRAERDAAVSQAEALRLAVDETVGTGKTDGDKDRGVSTDVDVDGIRDRLRDVVDHDERLNYHDESKPMTSSDHTKVFEGDDWDLVLENQPEALRAAFMTDASHACHVRVEDITNLEFALGSLHATFSVSHNDDVEPAELNRRLDEHDFPNVMSLYARRHGPKTGLDLANEELERAREESAGANDELEKLREEIRALEEERAAVQSVLDGDVADDAKEKGSGDDEGEQKGDGERRPLADQVVQLKDQHAAELADEQAKLQDALAKIDAERGDSGVVPNTEVARHASDAAEGGRPPLSADEVAEHVRRLREERDAAEEGEAALRDAVYDAIGAEAAAPYKERDAEVDRTRGERCGLVGETEDHIASGDADGAADAAARHAAAEEAHENAKKARADDLPRLREELERAREESAGANDELEKLREEIRALEEERAAVQSVLDGDVADDAKEKGSGDDEGEQKGDGERRPLADQVVQLKDQHAAELADEQAKLQDALAKIDAERGDSGVVPNTEVARHASDAAEGGRPPLSADEVAEHVRRLREERDAAEEGEAALRDAVYDAIGAEAAAPYKERDAEVDRTRGERCGLVGETEDHIASGDADGAADAAARHAAAEEAHENAKKARADDLPRLREELERAREESADANDELEKLRAERDAAVSQAEALRLAVDETVGTGKTDGDEDRGVSTDVDVDGIRDRLRDVVDHDERLNYHDESKPMTSSDHTKVFEGDDWDLVLENQPEALRAAFMTDASHACHVRVEDITNLEFALGSLHATFSVSHNDDVEPAELNRRLDEHDFPNVMSLYARRHGPKTGLDLANEELERAREESAGANDELEKLREEIRALEEERAAVQSVLDGDVADDAKEKGSGDDEGEQKGDGERRPLADQVVQLKDQHAAELADEQAKLQDALAKIDAERGDSGVVPNTEVARHASDAAEGGRPPLSADEVAEHVRRLREERDAAEEGEAALRDAVYDAIGAEAAAPYKERDAEVDRTRGERCGLVGETEDHIASGDADGAADAAARHAAAEEAHENAKKARADDLPRLREELERAREESADANDELEKLRAERDAAVSQAEALRLAVDETVGTGKTDGDEDRGVSTDVDVDGIRDRLRDVVDHDERLNYHDESKPMTSSDHTKVFEGDDWDLVLENQPEALRAAFMTDASHACHVRVEDITNLEFALGSLHATFSVSHNDDVEPAELNRRLDEHDFPNVMSLYARRHGPKTGLDLANEELERAREESAGANDELEKLREEIRALEEERAAVQSVLDGDVADDAKEKGSGDDEGEQKGDGERRPLADQVVQLKDQHAAELADEQAKLQDALAKIDAERGDSGVVPNTEVARHASDAAEGGRPPLSADEVAEHVRRLREERDAAEEGEAALRDAVYDAIGAEAAAPYKERDAEVDRTRGERCGLVGETEDHIASGDADGAADAAARHAAAEEAHENAKKARADDLPRLREELERAREESAGANDELEKLREEIRALEEERAAVQSVLDGDVADDVKEKGSGDDEGEQKGDGERRPLADQVVQLKDQHAAELADEQAKLQDALAKIDAERGDSGVVPNTEVARHASDAAEGGRPPLSADEVAEHVRRLREERDAAEEGEAALRDAVYDAIGAEAAAPYKERDAEVDRTRGERCGLVGETEDHIASGDADGAADAAARHAAAEEAHENAKKARADDLPRLREELERAREESADANDELEKLRAET
ncbi:hypothetical protein, conserved [Angomonas deanei]|uniref:Flagellar attachment zone protein 1 conserved domain-containing protein n=1 Tax=Angomonas deanei TaxID=59799 RepID=A0A7G2C5S1_9TRYP|nr:hypothetical protein, conserved [Angomonas deanei]